MAKLTKKFIDDLTVPEGKNDIIYWDDDMNSFGIRCYRSGKKSFLLQYRNGYGKSKRLTIGNYAKITPDQARTIAKMQFGKIASNIDVVKEKQSAVEKEKRDSVTLNNLFDLYFRYIENRVKNSTFKWYKKVYIRYIQNNIGKAKISNITKHDIEKFLLTLKDSPYMSNRVRAILSSIFNYSELIEMRAPNSNPVIGTIKYKEEKRSRYFNEIELNAIYKSIEEADCLPSVKIAIKLLMFTGCRLREILHLKWADIDLENGVIFIADSKTGPKTVEINSVVKSILNQLNRKSEYVCYGKDETKPLTAFDKSWKSILRNADISDGRIHDLRHTFATYAVSSGETLKDVGGLLGHNETTTTERYAHAINKRKQEATERIGKLLFSIAKPNNISNNNIALLIRKDEIEESNFEHICNFFETATEKIFIDIVVQFDLSLVKILSYYRSYIRDKVSNSYLESIIQ